MHDTKYIRENSDYFKLKMSQRGVEVSQIDKLLTLDMDVRKQKTKLQELQKARNDFSNSIGRLKDDPKKSEELKERVIGINTEISAINKQLSTDQDRLKDLLANLPNISCDSVPVGDSENDNREIKRVYNTPVFDFPILEHTEICKQTIDFDNATKMSGSRFSITQGRLVQLERQLVNYVLDICINKYHYYEIQPPVIVSANSMYNSGQLPKFATDAFQLSNGHYLIPTAEVPLTNILSNQIINEHELPIRYIAYTPCFRSEAGSANKDTRGIIRQHQFYKLEMVSIVQEECSATEHELMLQIAEEILKGLMIPYRVLELCTGDLGFCASKTYDIEAWIPSQNKYREIASISNCKDFQSRRMFAKYRNNDNSKKFVHMLNGTAMAIGRVLIAIIENFQTAGQDFVVPDILNDYKAY